RRATCLVPPAPQLPKPRCRAALSTAQLTKAFPANPPGPDRFRDFPSQSRAENLGLGCKQ
ncbi:hypothetical protein P7K49_038175, partial [Saguinus oedipus]